MKEIVGNELFMTWVTIVYHTVIDSFPGRKAVVSVVVHDANHDCGFL
jgi:hypothetical protein